MSAVESRLAAIAADHAPDQISPDDGYSWVDGCTCGWMGTESPNWDAQEWADMDAPEYRTYRLWAEHLAAVIASADDLAVIELQLLDDLTDPDPCEWDHNHSCQAHGYYYLPQGVKCPNAEAAEIVAAKAAEAAEAVSDRG